MPLCCVVCLLLLRRGCIPRYQRALDRVNTILPNHMQLDDLPDLGNVDIEHELMMGSVSNRLGGPTDDDHDDL